MYFDHIKRDRDNLYWQLQQLGFFISKVGGVPKLWRAKVSVYHIQFT